MAHLYSASPWFEPVGAVLNVDRATKSEWMAVVAKALTLEQQIAAEYEADRLNGTSDKVVRPTRTPVRLTRKQFNDEYVPDQIASWRHQKIANMRRNAVGR